MHRGAIAVVAATMALGFVFAPQVGAKSSNMTLRATLRGASESGQSGDMNGRGTASIRIYPSKQEVCWTITASRIQLPAAAAHIHAGRAGKAGPVQVTLSAPSKSGKAKGCRMGVSASLITRIESHPSSYYVNVHTGKYPLGAIRGQLGM